MRFVAMQWNIGGAQSLKEGADPALLMSYGGEDLALVADTIQAAGADIVTLQEAHTWPDRAQAFELAERLSFASVINHPYSESHLDPSGRLSQAILSRHPLSGITFENFFNPHWTLTPEESENGQKWWTHDKGMTTCTLILPDGMEVSIQTLHSLPFRRFGKDPEGEESRPVRESMGALVRTNVAHALLQGDFNLENPTIFFPEGAGFTDVDVTNGTTPKNRHYDHIFYKGVRLLSAHVMREVPFDHFPVVAEFEIPA